MAHRTFAIVAFCLAILCGLGISINLLLGMPLALNLALLGCGLVSVGLLIDWRRAPHLPPRALSLMLTSGLGIAFTWFPNGGLRSSVPLFLAPIVVFAALMLARRQLYIFLVLTILELAALIGLEQLHPEWLQPYNDSLQATLDYAASLGVICVMLALSVHFLVAAYHFERQRAEEASRAKSLFLSQMSHELRTPLNAVIGFSGQLLDKQANLDSARQQLYFRRIRANGEHLLALVNQILDLSRIEAGRLELFWQETDARRLLAEVTELMEVLAREKGLRLRLEMPEQLPLLRTDPARLRQILLNLLGNAVKFTPQGSVICRLRTEPDLMLIEIQDTGPGIPADQREAIFEPFVRLHGGDPAEGAGMGLTITRFLCEKMGYDLEVRDAPGGGSLFRVILPFKPVASEASLKI